MWWFFLDGCSGIVGKFVLMADQYMLIGSVFQSCDPEEKIVNRRLIALLSIKLHPYLIP